MRFRGSRVPRQHQLYTPTLLSSFCVFVFVKKRILVFLLSFSSSQTLLTENCYCTCYTRIYNSLCYVLKNMGVDKKEEIFILKKNVYSLIVIFLLLNSFSNHKVRKELGDFKNDIKARQYSLL